MPIVTEAYFRVFQPFFTFGDDARKSTERALRGARMGVFPEMYLTLSYLAAALAGAFVSLVVAVGLVWRTDAWVLLAALVGLSAGVAAAALTRLAFLTYPRMVATARARRIDAEFPSVVMLCYALARGGMSPLQIFRSVAEERATYGEISVEIGLILRDVDWLGYDLNTALQNVAATTPSPTLQGFMEGLVTIINSGADPRDYFKRQAEAQLAEAEVRMGKELELAALLAEVYVSGLLVLPLLLMVILSVLGALGTGGGGFIPFIVFGLIPLGSAGYLVLVDTLLPGDPVSVAKRKESGHADFGLDSAPRDIPLLPVPRPETLHEATARAIQLEEDKKAPFSLRARVAIEWARRSMARAGRAFVTQAIEKPARVVEVSGVVGLTVAIIGAYVIWALGLSGYRLVIAGTSLGVFLLVLVLLPMGVFHEMRMQRARRVDTEVPEMLSRLSGFNERGITLLKSFAILGRTSRGPLAKDLRRVKSDVAWNGNLAGALARMRARVNTPRMTKLGVLFERASAATGNMREVLDIAATEAARMENVQARKRSSMMSYVVVVYVVYAVFLYVVYVTADLFYGESGFATAASSGGLGGGSGGLAADSARLLFYHAVLIQGALCGLVSGKLGEGHILSGLKHAAILTLIAWSVFTFGVMG